MLASIQVLRMNAQEESGRDEAGTPPPALEPLEQNGGPLGDIPFDMPSPQFRPYDWRGNVDDGYESADSMPDLQSVSNDDEMEELSDEDNDEDDDARRAMRLGDMTVLTAALAVERLQSIEQIPGTLGRGVERVEEREREDGDVTESDTPVLETSTEEPRLEPPFITDGRGRVVWTSPAEEDKTSRPAEEVNGEPASRPPEAEAATGSGGLLGWFNALF